MAVPSRLVTRPDLAGWLVEKARAAAPVVSLQPLAGGACELKRGDRPGRGRYDAAMGTPVKTIRALVGVLALLALSNCATTHESVQDCKKAAYSFCDKTVKDAGARGPNAPDVAARNRAYQQCLDTQLGACGIP